MDNNAPTRLDGSEYNKKGHGAFWSACGAQYGWYDSSMNISTTADF